MSFLQVFRSLQEVFPQVDRRILKAVAIEHSLDVDAAVEFILSDVLPFLEPPEALHSFRGTTEIKLPSADAELNGLGFVSSHGAEETTSSSFPGPKSVASEHTPGVESANHMSSALSVTAQYMDEATSSAFFGSRPVARDNALEADHASAAFSIKRRHVEEAYASLDTSLPGKSVYMEEPAVGAAPLNKFPQRHEQVIKEPYASLPLESTENALACEPFHIKAPNLDDLFADDLLLVHSGNDSENQSCISAEEAMVRGKNYVGSCQGLFAATSLIESEDANVSCPDALNIRDNCQLEGSDMVSAVSTSCQQFTLPTLENFMDSVTHGAAEENGTKSPGSQYEELEHGAAEENSTKSSGRQYEGLEHRVAEENSTKSPGSQYEELEHGAVEENSTKSPGSQYKELEHGAAEENSTKSPGSQYEELGQVVAEEISTKPSGTQYNELEHGATEESVIKSPGSQYEELEHGATEESVIKSPGSQYEELKGEAAEGICIKSPGSWYEGQSKPSVEKADDVVFDTEIGVDDIIDNPATITTRSGQVVRIDFLEDFITDAKNSKKTLASAMESVVCMMKEVELHEREANQAKEEASKAGLDILAKVDSLKKTLSHAKEANDMHAGEVYGEKSILATEARELQSRLLSLSDERDRSLSIIAEMHQTLDTRLAAVDTEREAAEQEKIVKDKMAREALTEQELIMDKVVQESKKLHEQAAENAKLREFLMDRGRIVDILQGEIGVICQDVMYLKERVDSHAPLGKSLLSILTSCSLASSRSSHKSSLSGRISDLACSTEKSTESAGQEFLESQQLEDRSESHGKSLAGSDHKASSDDDWDLVAEEGEMQIHPSWGGHLKEA